MDKKIIAEIKKKREFSGLPDSLVARFSEKCDGRVKETRALLRKFFGVFLTNKVLKGEGVEILKHHKSSMERDYRAYYSEIFNNIKPIKAVIDLGCGANGFSYELLKDIFGTIDYIGLEAVGQLVDKMNNYFTEENLLRLFDVSKVSPPFYGNFMTFFTKNIKEKSYVEVEDYRFTDDVQCGFRGGVL